MNKELVSQLTHMQESVVWEQFVLLIALWGLKVANTTAQAFAKKPPVVVISEAPGTNERTKKTLLHHKVRDFDTQLKVFEQFRACQEFCVNLRLRTIHKLLLFHQSELIVAQ